MSNKSIPIVSIDHERSAALKNSIARTLRGKMLPIDQEYPEKNLQGKVCLSPFVSLSVCIDGKVRLCGCAEWMPMTIGNLFVDSLTDMLASERARRIRTSIADGSYRYCNERSCGIINNNGLNDIDNVPDHVKKSLSDPAVFSMPNEIIIAGDLTCNLSCPSCRTGIIKNDKESLHYYQKMGQKIRSNLFSQPSTAPIRVMLSTSGELFASPFLLEMVNGISVDDFPNLSLVIQTNGLLAPSRWNRLGSMRDRVSSVVVTVDAARAETYETLRRGGLWKDLTYALNWLSQHKQQTGIEYAIRMIVQRSNYQEMEEFWHMGQSLQVDHVEYGRLLNWDTFKTTDGKDFYVEHDVFNPSHPEYQSATEMLEKVRKLPNTKFWGGL